MIAKMDSWIERTEVCVGKLETNPVKLDTMVEHQEVRKEEASVETFGALTKQYGDKYLATERNLQLKKWNQGYGGSWKKLAATCRGMTCHAIPALGKGHGQQSVGLDDVQGTQKGGMFRKRCWAKPEYNDSIKN
jgi:hypothetical protein